MIDERFPALSRAIGESAGWRAMAAFVPVLNRAWADSRTASIGRTAGAVGGSTWAIVIAAAGIIAIAAAQFVPVYVRTGLPRGWAITGVAFAVIVAIWIDHFRRAWPASILGRAVRALFRPRTVNAIR
jgi:hypothetical protein